MPYLITSKSSKLRLARIDVADNVNLNLIDQLILIHLMPAQLGLLALPNKG